MSADGQHDGHRHLHGLDRGRVPEPYRSWKDTVNVPKHETARFTRQSAVRARALASFQPAAGSAGQTPTRGGARGGAQPALQYSWLALASAQFFGHDPMALRPTVERAVSINPLSADDVAVAALYLECAGDSNRARDLFRDAAALNPHHPGWYDFVPFLHEYRRGEYERALASATRINMPLLASSHFAAAAAAGQLGRIQEVLGAFAALRRIHPALLDPQRIRDQWETVRWVWDEELVARLIAGFEKAHALHRSAG